MSGPIDICKLCLRSKQLRDSHYVPASFYRRIRKVAGADPIVMTPSLVMTTSRQIHDYVFCADCEHRLNIGGEKYVIEMTAERDKFPLRDLLGRGSPSPLGPFLVYSGRDTGVNIQKLVYFAISMVWRGGVHVWHTIDGQTSHLESVPYMEEMRRFLMGEMPLPNVIGLTVIVCLDSYSQDHTFAPFLVGGEVSDTLFEMLAFGLTLRVGINHPEKEFYALSCTHTPYQAVVVADCTKAIVSAVEDFHKRARHTEKVKKIEANVKPRS